MNSLLEEKEEGVRRLKETLRKSQQQGDDSILQGEDLHARLTAPRGVVIKSSTQLEKSKLEDEVKRLQVKISDLESSVSSKEEDVGKWKNRAIALRLKSKAELEKPSSPCTPTKRGHASSSSSYGSPKKSALTPRKAPDSPQSRFSELLSRTCPRQFFDNSALGTVPGESRVRRSVVPPPRRKNTDCLCSPDVSDVPDNPAATTEGRLVEEVEHEVEEHWVV
ncbi:hypothetical protein EYF80_044372 [Liparis tanakae]|uniref:Uncharacterized protein n=1 Tax=Liparis tanakae TaxID=230148 RepID=A0A4Z2FW17_9TELE|nr:hypothetical protein EYF80_044372 [Liparis tanakae]